MDSSVKNTILSKSKYLSGIQCPKLIWHLFQAKQLIPLEGKNKKNIFDQGRIVGEYAKKLFPEGISISLENGLDQAIADSMVALKERRPIYEASFKYRNAVSRADILVPVDMGAWDLVEVKSSTKEKEVHLHDIAFQLYCTEGAGLKIRNVYLLLINSRYVRHGAVDPQQLFVKQDVTEKIRRRVREVGPNIQRIVETISLKQSPEVSIGQHCIKPYECEMKPVCWKHLPPDNILTLGGFSRSKSFELTDKGILDICEIVDTSELNANQLTQWKCRRDGVPHYDQKAIQSFLNTLTFPLYLIDFETVGSAIPLFDQVSPYQHVPFQFSVHEWKSWEAEPKHQSFLASDQVDPRPKFLKMLKKTLGKKGSIVAYNMPFELDRLKESVKVYSEYAEWLDGIRKRAVDLYTPFKKFQYYNPKQKGSASVKHVYSALTGKSYEGMEIADGGTASTEISRMIFTDVSEAEALQIRKALEAYCKLDTLAMVEILRELRKQLLDIEKQKQENKVNIKANKTFLRKCLHRLLRPFESRRD